MSSRKHRVSRRRVRGPISRMILALVLAVLLASCVSVPVSGPVEAGDAGAGPPDVPVEIAPEPPQSGASPKDIVEGFLQAMANYQSGYQVARLYLAQRVRESWRPENGVQIYADDYPIPETDNPVLQAPLVGTVAADGSYSHQDEKNFTVNFGLVKDKSGEWRIGKPPHGLLMSQYYFNQFYRSLNLYFFDPGHRTVVPDPIYLPTGNQTATALLQALLRGPTNWLKPAVVSAIPAQTALNVSSPIDTEGIADISLSDPIATLNEEQRSQLAAQITWTLRQLGGITGIRLQINGNPFPVVRDQNAQGVIPIDAHRRYAPIPIQLSAQLMGIGKEGVVRVDEGGSRAESSALPGPLGKMAQLPESLAVSTSGDEVAMVRGGGSVLLRGQVADVPPKVVLQQVSGLLRPQFSRFDELWAVGRNAGGQQTFWMSSNGQPTQVAASAPKGSTVSAFRISPDGVRMVIVRQVKGKTELGLARINRSSKPVKIDGWHPIAINGDQTLTLSRILDVAWLNATSLMILAATVEDGNAFEPYVLDQDGSTIRVVGQSDDWRARALAISPREEESRAMLLGDKGIIWRYQDESRWENFGEGFTAIAYPG